MEIQEIINSVINSKKYSTISYEIVERISVEMSKRYKKKKDIIAETKKQLHIIYESFLTSNCQLVAKDKIEKYNGLNLLEDIDFSKELLSLHVSTKERIGYESEIYSYISQFISEECILADVGCGFNPFALPFFINRPSKYFAYEISVDTVDVLNLYFDKVEKKAYKASILDAVSSVPPEHINMMFAFKLLPLLQQQKKGRAIDFLTQASFDNAIVSFPIKSISGKNKGMEEFYSSFIEDNLPSTITIIDRVVINNELFYALKK